MSRIPHSRNEELKPYLGHETTLAAEVDRLREVHRQRLLERGFELGNESVASEPSALIDALKADLDAAGFDPEEEELWTFSHGSGPLSGECGLAVVRDGEIVAIAQIVES